MSYTLGVDLGTTFTAAAIARGEQREVLNLGTRFSAIPSVLFIDETGSVLVGDTAERRGEAEPSRMARHFKRRLGDTAPILIGSTPYHADRLTGRLLAAVVSTATDREGERPARVVVTHPANWGPYKKDLLDQAIQHAGIDNAQVLTEPEAAAIHYSLTDRMPAGDAVAVYDLGGGTFDATVLRKTPDGFEVLGQPQGIERLGGIDFDEALVDKVLHSVGATWKSLGDSPQVASAAIRLREECTEAKEALSHDTQVAISVRIGDIDQQVVVTRSEFEELIRPLVDDTTQALDRAIRQAGLVPEQLRSILLVGGSSRIPLIGRRIAEEFGRPFAVDIDPKLAVALGAVALGAAVSVETGAATITPVVAAAAAAAVTAAPAPPPPPPPASPPPPAAHPVAPPPLETPVDQAHRSRSPWLVGGLAAVAAAAIAVALVIALGSDDNGSSDFADSDTSAATVPDTAAPDTTAPSTTTSTTAAPVIGPLQPTQVTASATAAAGVEANGNPVTYDAVNTLDGSPSTTWRTPGNGIGEVLVVDLGRTTKVTSVGLLPGYGKIDPTDGTDRFAENRRVRSVRWSFDDGTTIVQDFADQPIVQSIDVAAESQSIVIEILDSTSPGGRDFTAISQIAFSGEQ